MDSNEDTAVFLLRHFGAQARLAALGLEAEANQAADGGKAERWRQIGARISILMEERGLAAFAVAPSPRRARRSRLAARRPAAAATMSAPAPKGCHLRLVVS